MSKWSDDAFLDTLRCGDPLADEAVRQLEQGNVSFRERKAALAIFKTNADTEDPEKLAACPEPLRHFFETSSLDPENDLGIDQEMIRRGGKVFLTHSLTSALVLLAKSLIEGYSAPQLTRILMVSRELQSHPWNRLLGVLQILLNIADDDAFRPNGTARVTAQKLRLLHAGIRVIVRGDPAHGGLPGWDEEYGAPVCHEDMLATGMGFCLLLGEGLQKLGAELSPTDQEALYYPWKIFMLLLGIHPAGQPTSTEYIPQTLAEAGVFYASYERRAYVGSNTDPAKCNPEGIALARADLDLLNHLVESGPTGPIVTFVLRKLPEVYMQKLVGDEGMRRVGLEPPHWHLLNWLALQALALWMRFWDLIDRKKRGESRHERLSRALFCELISKVYGREGIQFGVPTHVEDVCQMIHPGADNPHAAGPPRT